MKKILTIVAVLIMMSAPTVMAQEQEPCVRDRNHDGEVNAFDTTLYKAVYLDGEWTTPCPDSCGNPSPCDPPPLSPGGTTGGDGNDAGHGWLLRWEW